MVRVLNVAEKPSVAKTVSAILSNGSQSSRPGLSKYNPIYDFRTTIEGRPCEMCFTSVTGHLMEMDFPSSYQSWETVDFSSLFTAPLLHSVTKDKTPLLHTLQREARNADWLILWLDCDREGENIAFEVVHATLQAKATLRVLRARFSALIPADILHALTALTTPNRHLSDAVDARQEIDLRVGAAFTRFQTLLLRGLGPVVGGVVSYGPCQFPTLGFVVDAFKRRMAFVRERYWSVGMEWGTATVEGGVCQFKWARGRIFDRIACILLYESICESDAVRVERIDSSERKRRRPLPLSTVEMQKRLSSHAHLTAARSMDVAEKLYQRGLISYPRTETDKYKEGTDMQQLLITLSSLPGDCGPYAQRLLTGGFVYPSDGGHDDGAHPPIHPTKADSNLAGDEKVVYEFIVRHFLACCSADAVGQETDVTVRCSPSGEGFSARGLMVTQRNYLDVYRYDRWYGHVIPVFTQGQHLQGVRLSLSEGQTVPPPLLTESDLIACMDRHGIGTDATIAQHIDTIQKRKYVTCAQRTFIPTPLGLGLVQGYEEMGLSLGSPALRAHMEGLMKEVGEGRKGKEEVVREVVEDMKNLLVTVQERKGVLCDKVEEELMRGSTPEQRVLQQGLPLRDEDEGGQEGGAGGGGGPGGGGRGGGGGEGGGGGPPHRRDGGDAPSRPSWQQHNADEDIPSPPASPRRSRRKAPGKADKRGGKTASRSRRGRSPSPSYPNSRGPPAGGRSGGAGGAEWSGGGGGVGTGGIVGADVECYRCKGRGHYANQCPTR